VLPGSQGSGCSMLAVLPTTPRSIASAVPEPVSPARNAVPNPVFPHVTAFLAVSLMQEQSGDANLVGFKTLLFFQNNLLCP
jgi:hypothetical protein